jgi:hypothetical protein
MPGSPSVSSGLNRLHQSVRPSDGSSQLGRRRSNFETTILSASPARSRRSACCIDDWYADGRIGGRYRVTCYRAVLAEVPDHALVYGSLREDMTRALSSGIDRVKGEGVSVGPETVLPALGTRLALSAPSSRAKGHSGLTYGAIAAPSALLVAWFVARVRDFRSLR